jgi:hypothetical protein
MRCANSISYWATALFAVLATSACGGAGAPPDPGGGGGPDPFGSMAPKTSFTDAEIRHLLVRTRFGVTPADLDRVAAIGVPAFVAEMLVFPPVGSTPWEQTAAQILVNEDDPPGLEGGFPNQGQVAQWWQSLCLGNPNAFQEALGLFWHDHFATSTEVLEESNMYWFVSHANLFRGQGTGNLRALLVAVARDWAMLRWLDGITSTKDAPNENFAREFWELFTRGVDQGYTQADILEAARAFTGYRQRFNATTGQAFVEFDPNRHDPGSKTVLGSVIPGQSLTDDYQAVVDITLDTGTLSSEWFARKFLEHYCYADPPQARIDELAALLRGANWEIAPVLQALFVSEAFYSEKALEGFVKSPVEQGIGFMRSANLPIVLRDLDRSLVALGHRPSQPPNVNGWPGGELWLSAQGMVERSNLVEKAIAARTYQAGLGISVADLLPTPTATSGEVVDALSALLRVDLAPDERTECVTYMDTQRLSNGTVISDPFDPTNPTDIDERVRGLLYILGQHPLFLIR